MRTSDWLWKAEQRAWEFQPIRFDKCRTRSPFFKHEKSLLLFSITLIIFFICSILYFLFEIFIFVTQGVKTPRHFCDRQFKPPVCHITDTSVSFESEPQSQSDTSAQWCSAPSQCDDGKTTQIGEQRSRLLSSFFLSIRPSAGLSLG